MDVFIQKEQTLSRLWKALYSSTNMPSMPASNAVVKAVYNFKITSVF